MPLLEFFLDDRGGQRVQNLRLDVLATLPALRVQVLDENDPVDLTGGVVTFSMEDSNGIFKILNAAAVLEDATNGIVRYDWTTPDVNVEEIFLGQFKIVIGADQYLIPTNADQQLRIIFGKAEFSPQPIPSNPSQGVQVVTLSGTPTLDAVSRIFKVVVPETAFTAAATEESIDLFQLPAGAIIQAMKVKHSAAFAGGAISAYTLSVGIAALTQKYLSNFDVFSAPAATNDKVATSGDEESHDAATAIKITAKSVGGDVADVTAGSAEVWVVAVNTLSTGSAITASGLETQKDGATVSGGPFNIVNFKDFDSVVDEGSGIVAVTAPKVLRKVTTNGFGVSSSTLFPVAELDLVIPAAGSYYVKWLLFVTQDAAAAGLKLSTNYTGGLVTSRQALTDTGLDNKTFNESGVNSASLAIGATISIAQAAAGDYVVMLEGFFQATGAGTMRISAAQVVTDASNLTTILQGSSAKAEKGQV